MSEFSLGQHPATRFIKFVMYLLVGGVLSGIVYLYDPMSAFVTGPISVLVVLYIVFGSIAVVSSGRSKWKIYNSAKEMISEGILVPSYSGKNRDWQSLMIVDEDNSQVFLNGKLYKFEDIKGFSHAWNKYWHYLEIVLKKGENPVQKVIFDSESDALNFYHRLGNTLNFS